MDGREFVEVGWVVVFFGVGGRFLFITNIQYFMRLVAMNWNKMFLWENSENKIDVGAVHKWRLPFKGEGRRKLCDRRGEGA